jgi:F0F1-type ATP synthase assembly protein I
MKFIDEMPLSLIVVACLTLGLAPFTPPHIWEKLGMLVSGTLTKPVDIFDLLMHSAPWGLLILKLVRMKRA